MKKVIIFGTTAFEERLKHLIENHIGDSVVAFCVDSEYAKTNEFCGVPLVESNKLLESFSPQEHTVLVGIGYKNMNELRMEKFKFIKELGFEGYNLIHPKAFIDSNVDLGQGNIILGDSFIDYGTKIGDCNIFEIGVHVSHECVIGNYNYISPGVTIGGSVNVHDRCFLGLGSILRSAINVDDKCLIGAGAYVDGDVIESSVVVPSRSKTLNHLSTDMNILYKRKQ